MKSSSIRQLLAVVATCISLTSFMTPTYASSIVIGGNWTDIGTITFVSPKPGDTPTTAGTALLNTINGITDNSATNPYLIKLGPGVYDIGTSHLQMKEYVDIEGAGEKTTVITGTVNNTGWPPENGVVNGANNAEIRFLTVRNTGSGERVAAIFNTGASPAMTHITAAAEGGAASFYYGVLNISSSSPAMTHVTARASGGGPPSGGATNCGVSNVSSNPTMNDVAAEAHDGQHNHGVYNEGSSPTMSSVTAKASGDGIVTYNYGISNYSSSSPTMTHVMATAEGGFMRNGIYSDSSSPTMTNVTAKATGAGYSYGLLVDGGTLLIDRSTFDGAYYSIYADSDSTLYLGASKLVSAAIGWSGTFPFHCVGVYKYIGGTISAADGSCN
jgi:hypothetical protein